MANFKQSPVLVPRSCTDLSASTDGFVSTIGHNQFLEDDIHTSLVVRLDYVPLDHMSAAFPINPDGNLWTPSVERLGADWANHEQKCQYCITPALTRTRSDLETSCLDYEPFQAL